MNLRWFLRPDLILADAALVGGIVAVIASLLAVLPEDAEASIRLLGAIAAGYGAVWLSLYVGLSKPHEPEARWRITRTIMRFSDVTVLFVTAVLIAPAQSFRPMWDSEPITLLGLPFRWLVAAAGYAGLVSGWIWIRRINRGQPEPEANDRFWWSRA